MNRFFLIFALITCQALINLAFADTATLNTQDYTLSLSSVRITNAGTYQNVILRLTSKGTVTMDDPQVGASIEYNPSSNTLLIPSVTVGNTTYSKVSLSGLAFDVLSVNGVITDTASLNPQDNMLTLSSVRVTNTGTYQNLILRVTSFGTIKVDDPRVGYSIDYDPATNTLFLPSVTYGNTTYSKVSLTGLAFTLVSLNGISINTGSAGSYSLDLVISASGVTTPAIHIDSIPKPNTQAEFCSPDIYQQFQQSVQGVSGSWQITSCSFDGTTGLISALLNITSPYSLSMPYSVRYTYVAK